MFSIFDHLIADFSKAKKGQAQRIWFLCDSGTIPEKIVGQIKRNQAKMERTKKL